MTIGNTSSLKPELQGLAEIAWRKTPSALARLSLFLGLLAEDGRYLSGLKVLRNYLAVASFSAGVAFGFFERDTLLYISNLWLLAAFMALGILAGQAGLWAFFGFIVANATSTALHVSDETPFTFFIAVSISWFFLFQLILGFPQSARLMVRLNDRYQWSRGLLVAFLTCGFVELWTRLSVVALRPLYSWQGREVPLELVRFVDSSNEWALGDLALHKLAWLALTVGIARWIMEPLLSAYAEPVSLRALQGPKKLPRFSLGAASLGRASAFTALVAGLFATLLGAGLFLLSVAGAIVLRGMASSNRFVNAWDRRMLRVPAAIRLIASYLLCLFLGDFLVGIFRDSLEWRTLTSAAVAIVIVFAVSLSLWPQVSPNEPTITQHRALSGFLKNVTRASPGFIAILLVFGATAAQAHHCSFEPGCECLSDNFALAALVAAGATLAHTIGLSVGRHSNSTAPISEDQLQSAVGGLAGQLQTQIDSLRFATNSGETAKIVWELFDLLKQAKDATELVELVRTIGVDVSPKTAVGKTVGGALTILVDPILDHLEQVTTWSAVKNGYSKEVLSALIKNAIYIYTADLIGASSNLGLQFVEIGNTMNALRMESLERVNERLHAALVELEAMRSGNLSAESVRLGVDTSRIIENELDPSMLNTAQKRASYQISILNDLVELSVREFNGEDISSDFEAIIEDTRTFRSELTGKQNITNFYTDFATQAAALLGLPVP